MNYHSGSVRFTRYTVSRSIHTHTHTHSHTYIMYTPGFINRYLHLSRTACQAHARIRTHMYREHINDA